MTRRYKQRPFLVKPSSWTPVSSSGLPQLVRTQIASDNFDRGDGSIAGANNWLATSEGSPPIASNQIALNTTVAAGAYRTGEVYTSNQYSQCAVGSIPLPSGGYIGVSVRNQDNANNYTLIYFNNGTNYQLILYKKVTGTYTQLFPLTLAGAQAQGTTVELVAEGTVLTAYLGGAALFAILDTTFTGGVPGIELYGMVSLDTWIGGNAKTGALSAASTSDNFNTGTAVSTDGQAWTLMHYPYTPATVDIAITSSQLSVQNPPVTGHAGDVRTDTFGADQWSSLQMGTAAMSATGFVGVTTRNQGSGGTLGNSGYLGMMFQNNAYRIYRLDSGVSTQIAGVPTLGNDPTGTSYTLVSKGTRHSFRVNGAEVLVATDTTYAVGPPGIMMYPNATADNWSGGNL